MSTGNRYSKKFKEHAIRLITEEGMSKAQVARDLGVTYQTLINWTKQHEKAEDSEKQKIAELEAELKTKDKQLDELKMTNEILKKAAAIFAKDNPEE